MTPFWVCSFFLMLTRALHLQSVLSAVLPCFLWQRRKTAAFHGFTLSFELSKHSAYLLRASQRASFSFFLANLFSYEPILWSLWVLGVHSGWGKSCFFTTSSFLCLRGVNTESYWDLFLGVFGCHPLWFQVRDQHVLGLLG